MLRGLYSAFIIFALVSFVADVACESITQDRCTFGIPSPRGEAQ